MNTDILFEGLIDAYNGYYNIKREDTTEPFDAEGYLSNEAEQYFLVKAAKIAFVNSYEHVFFKKCGRITFEELVSLDAAAWETGIARVKPDADHKNTDVALIVVSDVVTQDIRDRIDSFKHSRNYMLGFHGFSNYRLVVIEAPSKTVLTNRRGRDLRDFVTSVMSKL